MDNVIPACLEPKHNVARPKFKVPSGAWDTHFHILGPTDRYPYSPKRKYSPPQALLPDYLKLMSALGLERGIVVHPNTHGFDNAVDLNAMRESHGRFMGVVRLDKCVTEQTVEKMHSAGVRGVRFAFNPAHGGILDVETFRHVTSCISDFEWFVELHMAPTALVELKSWLKSIQAPIVIDHMGRVDVSRGLAQEPFRVLLDLVRGRNTWVKLSGADRISAAGYPYQDVVPFARELIAAAPDRMLWGTDWPHTGIFKEDRMPDDGNLLNLLPDYAPDENIRNQILVDNPCRLLGVDR